MKRWIFSVSTIKRKIDKQEITTSEKINYEIAENGMRVWDYYGGLIMQNAIIDEYYKVKPKSNAMRNELKFLNQKESEIINKLRTERNRFG